MDELKVKHVSEKKIIEESASKLMDYTDSVRGDLSSEN
jgi:hypothetical protein